MSTPDWGTQLKAAQVAEREGKWDDALDLYQSALDRLPADQAKQSPMILRFIGRVHFERGEYDSAMMLFERSLVAARELGQRDAAARALNGMAVVAQFRGRLDLAEEMYRRTAAIAEELGDQRLCAVLEQNLGTLSNIRGDLSSALMHYEAALTHFRKVDDRRACALILTNMGMLNVDVEQWAAAELSFDSANVLAEQENDQAARLRIANNRAELYTKRQNFERARTCCDEALEIASALGGSVGLGEVHKSYGVLYRETGRSKVAHFEFSLALQLARNCDNPLLEAETESERGRTFLNDKAHTHALQSLNRAVRIFSDLGARREILDLQRRLARINDTYMNALEMWLDEEVATVAEVPENRRGRRIAELALQLAKAVDFEDVHTLRIACHLLDIGNAALPAETLERSGPLNASERELVRTHTQRGDELLAALDFPAEVRAIVRYHHERWDGEGYPDGLAGEDIPMAARIAALADVFDALTSPRAYREAHSSHDALAIMLNDAGKQFDPELFRQFCKVLGHQPAPAVTEVQVKVRP